MIQNPFRIVLILSLFGFLILIRVFEDSLFYDPYLLFFENDYLYMDNPRREVLALITSTSIRYILNSIISLGVLYLFFNDVEIIKFSSIIYGVAYVILILIFLYFVINPRQEDYYLFFNLRRFLIQPILLLFLVPAFFYYKIQNKGSGKKKRK